MRIVLALLRAHAAPLAAIGLLATMLALTGVLVPTAVVRMTTAGLRYDLSESTPLERDLSASFPGGPASLDELTTDISAVRRSMPSLLRASTDRARFVSTSGRFAIPEFPDGLQASYLVLSASPDAAAETRIVRGTAPRAVSGSHPIEIMLTESTATSLRWKLGATHRIALADGTERPVTLTGLFAARHPDDGFWGHAVATLRPQQLPDGTGGSIPVGTAFVATGSYPVLPALPSAGYASSVQTTAWYPTVPDTLAPSSASAVASAATRFTAVRRDLPSSATDPVPFSTRLADVLAASEGRRSTALSLTGSMLIGPAGAALALEFLLARLSIEAARRTLHLLGSRGASPVRLRAGIAGLTLACTVPGAALGAVLGLIASESAGTAGPGLAAVLGAAVPAAAVPAAIAATLLPALVSRPSRFPVRPIAEGFVAAVAVLASVLVARQRTDGAASTGIDPLTVALPLVLAAAGCVGALRALPVVLGVLRRRAVRRRGVALSTGLAVAARSHDGLAAPLLAAAVGIAVALFSSVLSSTLLDGTARAAQASVGADVAVRTSGTDFTTQLPFDRIVGVDDVAFVSTTGQVEVTAGGRTTLVTVVVADSSTLRRVQAGVPEAPSLPGTLAAAPSPGVPVVLSDALAERLGGSHAEVTGTPIEPVGAAPTAGGLTGGTDLWMLVDQKNASDLGVDNDAPDLTLLRLEPGASAAKAAAAARAVVGVGVPIETVDDVRQRLTDNPVVPGVLTIARASGGLAALLGVLALSATVVLDSAARRRRLRILVDLGLDARQRRRLVVAESSPVGITALVAGAVIAAGMALLVLPSADLRTFTGSAVRPPIHVDALLTGALLAAGIAAIALLTLLAVRLGRPGTADRPEDRE